MSHEIEFRVYYQDTDAGGVVYHSNYLNFAERARAEFLRKLGVNQSELKAKDGLLFLIKSLNIEYKKPALLDDILTIKTQITETSKVRMQMEQNIFRDELLIAKVIVNIVCVNEAMKPTKIPDYILA